MIMKCFNFDRHNISNNIYRDVRILYLCFWTCR